MGKQINFSSRQNFEFEFKTFRTIHYLGSKLRILDFIKEVVDELSSTEVGICDLFAGSGSVSQHFSSERKVVAVDIQKYSNTICSALLKPSQDDFIDSFVERVKASGDIERNLTIFEELVRFEDKLINGKVSSDLELICNFLEFSSLYSALISVPSEASMPLKKALISAIKGVNLGVENKFLAATYFGGVYFSYKQALIIDAILIHINKADSKYKDLLLAALLSTASDVVNTVGKQFAQPLRPRDKNGNPKSGIANQLKKDRNLDVLEIYQSWLGKYSKRSGVLNKHKVLNMDYREALDSLDGDIGLIYADPPYTRDHYSRFYHGLETLCLMDYPEVSSSKGGGKIQLSRGLYRSDRHQSDFCIKSKAPRAFKDLFEKSAKTNRTLLLSYSPYDKEKGAHPRVVELDFLISLAKEYFGYVDVKSPGNFSHSKLNRADLHLQSEKVSELLLVCRN
ncbi:DNA adenine methylase [Cellvibrio mixtus]|uniref:DNA adenine methylase n=1 Tax=Cellvibrio mixtus TaxID=39650 RepID=UPI000693ED34|nr:DNA adenine methylase [Cellvibrio mixtus]